MLVLMVWTLGPLRHRYIRQVSREHCEQNPLANLQCSDPRGVWQFDKVPLASGRNLMYSRGLRHLEDFANPFCIVASTPGGKVARRILILSPLAL